MDLDYMAALEYATKMHKGQCRKDGSEYILHPIEVSKILKEKNYNVEYQITALFHDLLEDTKATEEEILKLSNMKVLEAVKLLTKKKENNDMIEYITNITKNKMAFEVKLADRFHNLRSAIVCDNKFKTKYINDTTTYFYPVIKGSDFSNEIKEATERLIYSLELKS